jgi:hypothetical protein
MFIDDVAVSRASIPKELYVLGFILHTIPSEFCYKHTPPSGNFDAFALLQNRSHSLVGKPCLLKNAFSRRETLFIAFSRRETLFIDITAIALIHVPLEPNIGRNKLQHKKRLTRNIPISLKVYATQNYRSNTFLPKKRVATKRIRNRTKKNLAIEAAPAATPPKPKIPAMSAMTKKVIE